MRASPMHGRGLVFTQDGKLVATFTQDSMARAGFEPRFRRLAGAQVEVALRDCPFRDLADDYRELVCTLHRGLVEGMRLEPSAQREQNESSCREDQECLLGGVSPRRHVPRQVGEHRVDGIPP